ncbi:class I SAM-dependent RNA methyltransferase [Nocardia sp. NPDC127579]|uniref:class I SAM-dependent RNA methyltransferase n=1 Tax=Nocardia sp. NPDC127579 TaxID=3345402 RepID=UPI003637467A
MSDWRGSEFEIRLGPPGHGGFCVGRHEGRVVFVRHGLPGELVRAVVTEDRGGSFCRADAVEILEASPDRVPAVCPVSGPGGAGCCDFSYATPATQRALKATVVAEQLRRLADLDLEIVVEPITGYPADATGGWRTRVRLAVDAHGRAGVHRYRSTGVITDLRCPQPVPGAMDGIAERAWTPGSELVVAVDGDGVRHIVELAPAEVDPRAGQRRGRGRTDTDGRSRGRGGRPGYGPRGTNSNARGAENSDHGQKWPGADNPGGGASGASSADWSRAEKSGRGPHGPDSDRSGADWPGATDSGRAQQGAGRERRHAAARRAATHAPREEWVLAGSGRAVEYVAGRRWEVSATGFWQAHRDAAQCYSDLIAQWSGVKSGDLAWDLYSGAGVFAARLAEQVGADGAVRAVEFARTAVADGNAALHDLPWVDLRADRTERWIAEHASGASPAAVVLDPPRAGAGKTVIAALADADPARIIHIGCDPASFARDLGLYQAAGYTLTELRAFDAFPGTHHVECLALLQR